MATLRPALISDTACAGWEEATRCGNPRVDNAKAASNTGIVPPAPTPKATMRAGIWRMEKDMMEVILKARFEDALWLEIGGCNLAG
jgi:hypothetical protein